MESATENEGVLGEALLQCSNPVSPNFYTDDIEYFSRFEPRVHQNADIADIAAVQCQIDLLGKNRLGSCRGTMNPFVGNMTALGSPYCLPERLGIVSYVGELAVILDDCPSNQLDENEMTNKQLTAYNSRIIQALCKIWQKLAVEAHDLAQVAQQIQQTFMEQTKTVEKGMRRYNSLDEYFADRYNDFAMDGVLLLWQYGANICLTQDTHAKLAPIIEPLKKAIVLTNDYYSWQVEHLEHIRSGKESIPVNAVGLYMGWQSISVEEAKSEVRLKIISLEEEYSVLKTLFVSEDLTFNQSLSVVDWFKVLEAAQAGNALWAMSCPRYWPSGSQNPYLNYFNRKLKEDVQFFDDCMQSEDILPCHKVVQTPGNQAAMSLNVLTQTVTINSLFTAASLAPLSDETVNYPYDYISSLPSKGIRNLAIDALNGWYAVPERHVKAIRNVVNKLHNASLMLDDIQDCSPLRRGKPATHTVFGIGQTVNTASFQYVLALEEVQTLGSEATAIFIDELKALHRAQGHELFWTYNSIMPTLEQYVQMIDGKTSALFRMCTRLMQTMASANTNLRLDYFASVLGRYFQVRDDYINLTCSNYADVKGFCSDLDEGKYSLPLIHSMHNPDPVLQNILNQRKVGECLSLEMKNLILDRLNMKESLSYTLNVLRDLQDASKSQLKQLESQTGLMNWAFRNLLEKLKI